MTDDDKQYADAIFDKVLKLVAYDTLDRGTQLETMLYLTMLVKQLGDWLTGFFHETMRTAEKEIPLELADTATERVTDVVSKLFDHVIAKHAGEEG